MTVEAIALPPKDAQAYWEKKVPLSAREFYGLVESARINAFTVSGVAEMDMLLGIQESLGRVLAEGQTFKQWKDGLAGTIEKQGWGDWRLKTIFQTNIQTAYSVGRYKQMTAAAQYRPYWMYQAVGDARTRPSHMALNGRTFPHDHEFWDTFYPPNGFRCRCSVVSLSERQVESRGIEVETENPKGKLIEPRLPDGTKLPARLLMPDRGFDGHPGKEHFKPDLSKYPAHLKQNFLERLIGGFCPAGQFDQTPCHKKLQKYLKPDDLSALETLVTAQAKGGVEGYADWADSLLKNPALKGEIYPVGNLPAKVVNHLHRQGKNPSLSLVVVQDRALLHAVRPKKLARGGAITEVEAKALSGYFTHPASEWFEDMEDPAILMVWDRQGDKGKAVIRIERRIGKGKGNIVVSAGVIKAGDLNPARYKKI